MNGLALSIGLGLVNRTQMDSKQLVDNNIKRGLIFLKKIVSLTNPHIALTISGPEISIFIKGCKMGVLRNFTLADSSGKIIFSRNEDMIIRGDIIG